MELEKSPGFLKNLPEGFWEYGETGGVVRFLDPVFSEPLEPQQLPRCIREHERLGPGLEFLSALSRDKRLHMSLIIALHGQKEDFEDVVRTCGPLLTHAAAIGIEASWDYQPQSLVPDVLIDKTSKKRADFQIGQLKWLHEHCDYVLPSECVAWSDWEPEHDTHAAGQPADRLAQRMKVLWHIYESATKNENGELDERSRNRIRNLAFCAVQSVRHPAIAGQFGYWLSRLDDAQRLPAAVEAPLIVGYGFDALGEYLRECSAINSTTLYVPHTRLADMANVTRYLPHFLRMTTTCQATLDQLDVPFGF